MSSEQVAAAAGSAVFRPQSTAEKLRARHVPLDGLVASARGFEELAIRRLTADDPVQGVAVVGASGAGKSSFVAWVVDQLPDTFAAIRLPVSALSDPTDASEVLKLTLSTVLEIIELDAAEREQVHIDRADQRTAARAPTGLTGGKIGGGPIPASINIEVGSLRQEFNENKLAGEYLNAVRRIVAILVHKGITPVFVFEDTEAIVGGVDEAAVTQGFFGGPLRQFVEEIDAPCLVAVQTHLTENNEAYARLSATIEVIKIPHLQAEAPDALARILERCLDVSETVSCRLGEIIAPDALAALVQFYDETSGDVRKTLAAAHTATEEAAAMGAQEVRAAHVRIGVSDWR